MKINLFGDFKEENRVSINNCADDHLHYLKKYSSNDINLIIPQFNNFFGQNNLGFRSNRYFFYPRLVKKIQFVDIAHIVDHQYAHLVKYINSKIKIITVHDLIPEIFSKFLKKNPYLLRYSLKHLKYFDKIITVSKNTKADIIKHTDCPENKIKILYQTAKNFFNTTAINKLEVLKSFNLPIEPIKILITGKTFYKNTETSLKILTKLLEKNIDVIFVHLNGGELNYLYKNKIFKINHCSKEDVAKLYKVIDILLFPSLYEGVGLPCLEAMLTGVPIVCSNNSSIPEIVGDAALMCDAKNVDGFVNNIIQLLNNKNLYNQKKQQGIERAKMFSDNEKYTKDLLTIYQDLLKI